MDIEEEYFVIVPNINKNVKLVFSSYQQIFEIDNDFFK